MVMARRMRGLSVQVRHYVGVDPATGKQAYLERTIPLSLGMAEVDRVDRETKAEAARLRSVRREQRWQARLRKLAGEEG